MSPNGGKKKPFAFARARGPKCASSKKIKTTGESVFFISPQARTTLQENAFCYDRTASGQSIYNYFRDYDPSTGRYIESDPIGLAGGLNIYSYVSSNPVNKFDFYGLAEICNVGIPFSVGIPHTFLCANGQCGGKHGGGSGPALYSPISQIQNDLPDKPAASCSDVPEKDCDPVSFDECITQKLQARILNEPYFFAGQNCGTWAVETILECRKSCKKK